MADASSAIVLIMDMPWERKGYEDLARYYESSGMDEEAEVVRFIVSERFLAERSHPDEEQL